MAIMMSGPVTLTSMDQPLPCAQGYMDYVPLISEIEDGFERRGRAARQTNPATAMEPIVVTPNTYRIKLASRKGKEMYESASQ
jgi:hypothetical protein